MRSGNANKTMVSILAGLALAALLAAATLQAGVAGIVEGFSSGTDIGN